MKFNPFRPGSIVSPGMFAGRTAELIKIDQILFQTKHRNAEHFLISGERGIGKSSLLLYIKHVASGEMSAFRDNMRFNFLVVSVELDDETTYAGIISKIGAEIKREVTRKHPIEDAAKALWSFLTRWEALGIKYNSDELKLNPHELLEELTYSVEQTWEKIPVGFEGILILIDEADKPKSSAHLGEFCKLFTERLTKQGCTNVAIGMAGLPSVIGKLKESHESSIRIFHPLPLTALEMKDRHYVVERGLKEAEEVNKVKMGITPEALETICTLSEGYPHFIQQFAYSAFASDTDDNIDTEDVRKGAFGKNGAIEALGTRYFSDLYFDQIGCDEYREVLNAMSQHFDDWVTKAQLRKSLPKMKAATLNNAITALKARNIIKGKPGKAGTYRLPNRAFAVWIRSLTTLGGIGTLPNKENE